MKCGLARSFLCGNHSWHSHHRRLSTVADVRNLVGEKGWTTEARKYMEERCSFFGVHDLPPVFASPDLAGAQSFLFVPGNVEKMLEKAMVLDDKPDVLIPDLEDSVPVSQKSRAREILSSHLQMLHQARMDESGRRTTLLMPRVNAVDSAAFLDDLDAVVSKDIDGVSIGKIHRAADLVEVATAVGDIEERKGLPHNTVKIVPWLESASAVMNASDICSTSSRVIGVAFGAEDYTADVGVERTQTGEELAYAKMTISLAARMHNIMPIDSPHPNFREPQVLARDCWVARQQAYGGKFAIHPNQVATINRAFSPRLEEIFNALAVLEAAEEAESRGRGSLSMDGNMVDAPVITRSKRVLERWDQRARRGFQLMSS